MGLRLNTSIHSVRPSARQLVVVPLQQSVGMNGGLQRACSKACMHARGLSNGGVSTDLPLHGYECRWHAWA